jgi:hypothetical protein
LNNESAIEREDVSRNAFLALIVQFGLFFLIVDSNRKKWFEEAYKAKDMNDALLIMTKILAALLLHLNVINEVRVAKDMMSFALKNPELFSGRRFLWPIRFGVMKFFTGLLCMIANVFVL